MGLLNTPEMKPTPRNPLLGLLADALTAGRDFADRAKVPAVVPLLGGQGLGSLLLGKAPEELTDISYGNMPVRINPLAGRTASFVPEIKPGRKEQVADLVMAAQAVPGGNRAALAALGAVDTGVGKAVTVWHGSPHKFDRFDSSKIGTGEGAQAYGHGLYLAESPEVAKEYQRALGAAIDLEGRPVMRGGKLVGTTGNRLLDSNIELYAGDLNQGIKDQLSILRDKRYRLSLADDKSSWEYKAKKEVLKDEQKQLAAMRNLRNKGTFVDQGNLYKVDLPDEKVARMLDWDKPLSQQAPEVQAALNRLPPDVKAHIGIGKYDDLKGGIDIVKPLGGLVGDAKVPPMLRQTGIPGIRYLDGGSRGAGQGTSNFVVFPGEEAALTILERNGGLLAP